MRPGVRSRWRRRLLALLLGVGLALSCTELGLRWLVLSDSARAQRLGSRLRHPDWLASPNDDDYWKLLCRFQHPVSASAVWPDRMTGWTNGKFVEHSHQLVDERALGDRTPVLLYGDSFAEGVGWRSESFEGIWDMSPVHATHALLNYGVGGYGADQVLLLARDTLPRWAARKPIAIVALLLDNDLDRIVLSFRGGPKPRFHVESGRLVEPEAVETDLARYLERNPIRITSYLAQLVCRAPGILPWSVQSWLRGDESRLAEKQELGEAIVRATCRELRAHAQRSALMLMRARDSVRMPSRTQWQESLIRRVAAEEGLPVIDTREVLLHAIGGKLEELDSLYYVSGTPVGHWNPWGYRVVFEALRAFAEGGTTEDALGYVTELLAADGLDDPQAQRLDCESLGGALVVRYHEDTRALCFVQSQAAAGSTQSWYMGIRAGNQGPTSLRWALPAATRRITLSLRATGGAQAEPGVQQVSLHACQRIGSKLADHQLLPLRLGEPAREWSVDLQGGELLLRVESQAAGSRSPWILLEKARLE